MPAWAWAVLGAQVLVLTVMLFQHARWEDEAQSWLLARDASPWDLIAHRLRYEGSPGLWQLLLMPLAKAGLPFITVGVVSGIAAVVAGYLFLRFAPFPPLLRALFPLSYFVLYQYGVVARSYCLLAPLLFGIVILFPQWRRRPLALMVLLILLANVSVHGLLMALGMVVATVPAAIRAWPDLPRPLRRRHAAAALLGTIVLFSLVAVLWPPADLSSGGAWNLSLLHLVKSAPLGLVHAVAMNVVSVVVLCVTGYWIWRARVRALYVLPTAALVLLFSIKYFSAWNEGSLVLVWIAALWLGLDKQPAQRSRDLATTAMCAALGLGLAVQVAWSADTLRHEMSHPYSASLAAADYIRQHHLQGAGLDAAGYPSVAMLAYFPAAVGLKIEGDRPTTYWVWSLAETASSGLGPTVARGDNYVLWPVKRTDGAFPCIDGYQPIATFSGGIFYKTHVLEGDGAVLYHKDATWTGKQSATPAWCGRVAG